MKKNIIIGVLVITNILTIVFAFIQKQSADESFAIAEEQRIIADKAKEEAQVQMLRAVENAEMSRNTAIDAELTKQRADSAANRLDEK